jgi:hypothetical protein
VRAAEPQRALPFTAADIRFLPENKDVRFLHFSLGTRVLVSCVRVLHVCVFVRACRACLVCRVVPRTSQDLNIVLYQYSYQPSSAQVRSYLVTLPHIRPFYLFSLFWGPPLILFFNFIFILFV